MEIDDLIQNSIQEFSKKYPDIDPKKGKDVLTKIVKEQMSPKDAMGFDKDFFEIVYMNAYNLFKAGKYKESTDMFRLLNFFDPRNARFSMALGASLHKQKQYKDAIQCYIATTVLDEETPLPYYHASDCFLKENNYPGALVMLKMMLKRMDKNPKYAPLKEKVLLSVQSLEKEWDEVKDKK